MSTDVVTEYRQQQTETPYVGLRPYNRGEDRFFFGRSDDAKLLRNKVFSGPLTLFYAQSGVGKTSLLLTLVLPAIEKQGGHAVYFDHWEEQRPVTRLKKEILRSAANGKVSDIKSGTRSLADVVRHVSENLRKPVVLVLDQFEQFLLQPKNRGSRLHTELPSLVRSETDCHVVLSFREEFLGDLETFRDQILNLFSTTYRLEYFNEDQAREAIVRPAELCGRTYEAALVDSLLLDLKTDEVIPETADVLPPRGINLSFLQIVCERLWKEACKSDEKHLTRELYENKLGGTFGILRNYMDEIAKGLGWPMKLKMAKILTFLAPPSGIKMGFSLSDLSSHTKLSGSQISAVLDYLISCRIVRDRSSGTTRRFELFHDGLIKVVSPWAQRHLHAARKYKWIGFLAGLAGAASALIISGLWWNGYIHSTGEINRLLKMEPVEQRKQATAIINDVATYLWNKQDKQSIDELLKNLERAKDVIDSTYDRPASEAGSQLASSQAAPVGRSWEEKWPLTLLYNPDRVFDLMRFRELWVRRAQEMTANLGIPILGNIKLQADPALNKRAMLIRSTAGSRDGKDREHIQGPNVIEEQMLEVPLIQENEVLVTDHDLPVRLKEFFDSSKGHWRSLKAEWKALKGDDEGFWWAAPRSTLPLWRVAQHDPASLEELIVKIVADELLGKPELILTPDCVVYLLLNRSRTRITVEEALAAQGGVNGIREIFIKLIRNRQSLNDLDMILELLAKYPKASESAEQVALRVQTALSNRSDSIPERLCGRDSNLGASTIDQLIWLKKINFPDDSKQRYADAAASLLAQSATIKVYFGSAIVRFLAPDGSNLRSEFLLERRNMMDELHRRFGIELPQAKLYDESRVLEPREVVIESKSGRRTVTLHEGSNEWLKTIISSMEADYVADRSNLLSINDVYGIVCGLPPGLRTWLIQHYTFADLKEIFRATLSFSLDESAPSHEDEELQRHIGEPNLLYLPWLLGSLSFWSGESDMLNLKEIARGLHKTQLSRVNPPEQDVPDGELTNLVKSGIAALARDDVDGAARIFKQAIGVDERMALKAFLAFYSKAAVATQQRWLAQRVSLPTPGHVLATNPERALRFEIENLFAEAPLPPGDKFGLKLKLYLLWSYKADGETENATKILNEISAQAFVENATPEELYLMAFEAFDLAPANLSSGDSLVFRAFHTLPSVEAEAGYKELCEKYFSATPLAYKILSDVAWGAADSFWIPIYLADHLVGVRSFDFDQEALTLCERAVSHVGSLSDRDQPAANACIDYLKAKASLDLCTYGETERAKYAGKLLEHLATIVPANSIAPWPDLSDIYFELSLARIWQNEIRAGIKDIEEGRRVLANNYLLVESEFMLHLAEGHLDEAAKDAQEELAAVSAEISSFAQSKALRHAFMVHWIFDDEKLEYYARQYLSTQYSDTDYARLMLYWSLRRKGRDEDATNMLEQRWRDIDMSEWDTRLELGDANVWREMLIGYYLGKVNREKIFALLENWDNSSLRKIKVPRYGLMCEACFYDALLQDANSGGSDREQLFRKALDKVVATGQRDYYEYLLASCLLNKAAR